MTSAIEQTSVKKTVIPCAIYTRKSSDEGLDQDFNSLDAQREACEAFVRSQKGEGWRLLPKRYDDGGLSGGTLERPSLQRLIKDIEAGLIKMVVVYKIDRLTRSLTDFARLVERLEKQACSFVSVTQAFNTATSMGRLTLNVLLSFAQFEREVTAERIRDKIAASKKKGLWMGGLPPLGYDPHPDPKTRSLVINENEAAKVKQLFGLYETHRCLRHVVSEAAALGIRSKRREYKTGHVAGDRVMTRGQIHYLLHNPIYIGHIRHKGQIHEGIHDPIIEMAQWDRVQQALKRGSRKTRRIPSGKAPHRLLMGKLFDEAGERLTPSHTTKSGKRYDYYVSERYVKGKAHDHDGWRLPVKQMDNRAIKAVLDHLTFQAERHTLLSSHNTRMHGAVTKKLSRFNSKEPERPMALADCIKCVTLRMHVMVIDLAAEELGIFLGLEASQIDQARLRLSVPMTLRRRGVEARLIVGDREPVADPTLVKGLADAHRWLAKIKQGVSLIAIAKEKGCTPAYIRTRLQLAFLSPKIQSAIVCGTQPIDLTSETIIRRRVPDDWHEQHLRFGFEVS